MNKEIIQNKYQDLKISYPIRQCVVFSIFCHLRAKATKKYLQHGDLPGKYGSLYCCILYVGTLNK